MRFVTIIEDDPITGVKYGPVEIPFSNVPKHEVSKQNKFVPKNKRINKDEKIFHSHIRLSNECL